MYLFSTVFLSSRIVFEDCASYDYQTDRYYSNRVYDFSEIKDIKLRKKLFIDFMSLIIETENREILMSKDKLKSLSKKNNLTNLELNYINNIEKVYLLEVSEASENINWDELFRRVDVIPTELAITQSAIESGWGTSIFAKKANNMFGHWTYEVGTGIIPSRRDKGQTHEIAIFNSVNDSVKKYMLNLNTNNAYSSFRKLREDFRKSNKELNGERLSPGLISYSGIGHDYIKMINSIIADVIKIMEN
jgi:Bax protein